MAGRGRQGCLAHAVLGTEERNEFRSTLAFATPDSPEDGAMRLGEGSEPPHQRCSISGLVRAARPTFVYEFCGIFAARPGQIFEGCPGLPVEVLGWSSHRSCGIGGFSGGENGKRWGGCFLRRPMTFCSVSDFGHLKAYARCDMRLRRFAARYWGVFWGGGMRSPDGAIRRDRPGQNRDKTGTLGCWRRVVNLDTIWRRICECGVRSWVGFRRPWVVGFRIGTRGASYVLDWWARPTLRASDWWARPTLRASDWCARRTLHALAPRGKREGIPWIGLVMGCNPITREHALAPRGRREGIPWTGLVMGCNPHHQRVLGTEERNEFRSTTSAYDV